jgi:hypothetical protein
MAGLIITTNGKLIAVIEMRKGNGIFVLIF